MLAGKAELREVIDGAVEQRFAQERCKLFGKRAILFVNYLHRWKHLKGAYD